MVRNTELAGAFLTDAMRPKALGATLIEITAATIYVQERSSAGILAPEGSAEAKSYVADGEGGRRVGEVEMEPFLGLIRELSN